ncbi:MAG: Ig-like domain-containing protein, partial [Bacteroidales bacterium]|nr:Ig-like domain-containing protein [Bacteroidales bacterium]
KSATCQVTVSKKVVPVTAIEFIETDHSVYIGKSIQLSVKLTPSNATETPVLTSSDESIATVDENGKVTGVSLGNVTITAAVGDKKATYSVEVHNPLIESITIEPSEITIFQGDTARFTIKVDPPEVVIKRIIWSSSDNSIVRSTLDENYEVKNDGSFVGVGSGTTTVHVSVNATSSATANVTVVEPDYMAKEKAALMAFYNAHKNHWSHHDNWGADGPVTSAWEGVEMDPTGTHVKGLQIWDGLGKIPKEIEDLTELEYLSFNCNLELSYGLPKSTFGPLPKEIGNLKKLKRIVMYDYPLTGKLPESLFTLSNLETLYIVRSQYMDNAPLSSSIGQLTNLEQLDLNTNNFSGSLPKEIGNLTKLTWLNLSYNSFTGTIPASYSGLRNLENFDLMGNGLSGTLPASLAKIERFPLIWGRTVQFNNFTQEDVRKSKIPAPISPPVKTISGKELDIEAFIKGNKYTVLFDVAADYPEVAEYLASLENLYKKGKSKGLGVLTFFDNNSNKEPDLSRRDQLFKDLLKKSGAEWESFIRHMYDEIPTEKAPFYAIKGDGMYPYGSINQIVIIGPDGTVDYTTLVDSDQKKNVENALKYLEKALNVSMTHYESKSYSRDGNYKTLQKASTGKGIDLVITGDAFSDRDITGGTFEKAAKQAMNDLFMVEPLKSMKNRFNVYMVEAVSKNDEYFSRCSTVFSGVFGSGSAVGGDNKKVLEYAKKVIKTDDKMDNVMVLVLMNSYRDAGTTYMMDPADESIYAGGASVIWIPYKDVTVTGGYSNMATTIIHEVGGHGLGKLADEYSYLSLGEVTSSEVTKINKYHKWNRFTNISLTSNPNQVLWKQFIGDSAFASENIGVYEGGDAFWSGVWRPTEQSVMNDSYNHSAFNAPSRSQLYTRIMKLSEGSSWKYDYNTFKTWDKAHPTKVATRSIAETDKEEHVHIPPVLLGKTWKEVIDGR